MYGFASPGGVVLPPQGSPGGIMQNGSRAQDGLNAYMNRASYDMYLFRLMDLAMSVFKWDNLPEGVDERMLEYWMLMNGFCLFFHDDDLKYASDNRAPEGYAVLPAMISGQWDMYNYPRERRAYAVNGLQVDCDESNSVLMFNDYLRVPMWPTLELYARRLSEIDRTIDVNVRNQKTPKIFRGTEQQRLTFSNMMKKIEGNEYWIWTYKGIDPNQIEILDMPVPNVTLDLQTLKHQIWNEALTFLGVENTNTEKKERLISQEVFSNMGDVEAQRFTRLNARQRACDDVNRLFGLDVEVSFRSGTYIKADGYGSQNIPVKGMGEGEAGNDGAGYGSDGGLLSKIRGLLS